MSNILDGIMQSLGSEGVSAIASKLGVDPATAENAVKHALPVLVGAMAKNSTTPEGADALHKALQAHTNAATPQQQAQQIGQGDTSLASEGSAILGHLLGGGQQGAATSGLSSIIGGLSHGGAGSLLSMLAPMVMSYVGHELVGKGMNSGQVASSLGQEANSTQAGGGALGSLLSSVLGGSGSSGGAASELGGIAKIGASLFNAFKK